MQIIILVPFVPAAGCLSGAGHTGFGWSSGPLESGGRPKKEAGFSEALVGGGGFEGVHDGSLIQKSRLEEGPDRPIIVCVAGQGVILVLVTSGIFGGCGKAGRKLPIAGNRGSQVETSDLCVGVWAGFWHPQRAIQHEL